MPIQLTLICQAVTGATRHAAFPADDALDAGGVAKAAALAGSIRRVDAAWTSPARAARQTAEALGLEAGEAGGLREIDYGCWAGRSMDDVGSADPVGFAAWLADPAATPHGGESIDKALERAADWLALQKDEPAARVVAITHASFIRCAIITALGAPSAAFWRIDVAPLCRAQLRGSGRRWTLRSLR